MLVREAAKLCQGGGGGKKDLAQAGGKILRRLMMQFVKQRNFVNEIFRLRFRKQNLRHRYFG